MISLKDIRNELDALSANVAGHSTLSRLLIGYAVWQMFDKLRSSDGPFDRAGFMAFIRDAAVWSDLTRGADGSPVMAADSMQDTAAVEAYTGSLYSQCWVPYSDDGFMHTVSMLEGRLRNNGIGPELFEGYKCIDMGCGGGRFSIAMHLLGAKHVTGIDIGIEAINDAKRRREAHGISPDKVHFENQSLLSLPETWDNQFDRVLSSGVLHHTVNPELALQEAYRILKPGGIAFIYVYGAGGLHWEMVDWVRALVHDCPEQFARQTLRLLDAPVGKVFHIMDHWFVPNYETLTATEFEARCKATGFTVEQRLFRGLYLYESSERLYQYPEDADLMGEGDLRYLLGKKS